MRSLTCGVFCAVLAVSSVVFSCAAHAAAAKAPAGETAGESMQSEGGPPGPPSGVSGSGDIWAEVREMQERLNRIIDDASWHFQPRDLMEPIAPIFEFYPDVDVRETGKEIIVRCDLPGMEKDKIDISFKDGSLIITGKRELLKEESSGMGWYMRERSFGSFERVVPIAMEIKESEIKAEYKNGVLTVTLPKAEGAMKPGRKIQIL